MSDKNRGSHRWTGKSRSQSGGNGGKSERIKPMIETKHKRGFAAMSKEKRREIAARGGRRAHRIGTAHEWTVEEAREAGRKGGRARTAKRLKEQVAS